MTFYYQDEHVTLYHGDCVDAPAEPWGSQPAADPWAANAQASQTEAPF